MHEPKARALHNLDYFIADYSDLQPVAYLRSTSKLLVLTHFDWISVDEGSAFGGVASYSVSPSLVCH